MEETRRRVDEIGASMEAYRERLDHRYRRVSRGLIAMVAVVLLSVVAGYSILQGERWDAMVGSCELRNQQAEATVALLRDVGASDRVTLVAMVRYPHTPPLAHREGVAIRLGAGPGYDGPLSCPEAADLQVGWLRL